MIEYILFKITPTETIRERVIELVDAMITVTAALIVITASLLIAPVARHSLWWPLARAVPFTRRGRRAGRNCNGKTIGPR